MFYELSFSSLISLQHERADTYPRNISPLTRNTNWAQFVLLTAMLNFSIAWKEHVMRHKILEQNPKRTFLSSPWD
jgi:hypothetical protein